MAKKRMAQNSLNLMLNLGIKEEICKPVRRVREVAELEQTTLKQTTLDPTAGRVSSTTLPAGAFTPSGHYVPDSDKGILGECVFCREIFAEEGTPDMTSLVAKAGGGGACVGCGVVCCSAHGAVDSEGRFWCEECGRARRAKLVRQTLARAFLGRLSGLFGVKDE